jgi:5'(3')-deoxyribonucleotidase
MKPLPEAVDSFERLSANFDVFILSTAPWENPSAWSDKLEWIKMHLGEKAYKRLILTHRKDLIRGDFLIDDRDKNGANDFKGELIRFGSEKFRGWQDVTRYLLDS